MKIQRKLNRFLAFVFILSLIGISINSTTYTGGAPASLTNAPGEGNCTTCHGGSLQTSGTNYNNTTLTGNFTGGGYIPDSVYTVTLSYSQSGKSKFGFQATVLSSNNAMAGSLATITGNNTVSTTTGTISGASRTYVRQTSSGTAGSGGRSWSFEWTAPSTNLDSVTFYVVVNSTNSNSGTGGDIIIAKEFKVGPSTLLPSAIASPDTTICQASSLTLSGSGTNSPTAYNWTLVGGSPNASTNQNPSVVYNNPGTYRAILVVTNAKGTSAPDTATIVVSQSPTAFISGGNSRTICEGDSLELSTLSVSGNSYLWSNGATTNPTWVKDSGDYQVVVTGSNGCSRISNIVSINYYPKPSATLSSDASIFNDSSCLNTTLTLMASSAAFDSFYYYKNGVEIGRSDDSSFQTTFTATATYGLRVKSSDGCLSDLSPYVVNGKSQQPAPSITCNIITPTSVEYLISSAFAHAGYQISVDSGSSWSSPSSGSTGNTHLLTGLQPEEDAQLWVRALDAAPCFFSKIGKQVCTSDTCSQLEISYLVDSAYCFGEIATLEVNGLAGKNYGLTFEGGGVFTDTVFTFQPTITKDYILNVIDSTNLACPAAIVEIPIVVDRIYDILLKPDNLGAYCPGSEITYSANDTLESFEFLVNDASVQTGASNTYSSSGLAKGDEIKVIVEKGSCKDTSAIEVVNIEDPGDATFSESRVGSVYSFTPTVNSHSSYAWDFGDGNNSTDVAPTNDYASSEGQDVDVTLSISTVNNCDTSFTKTLSLPMFSNVTDLNKLGLSVYPNPVSNFLNIENKNGGNMVIQVKTLDGKLISTVEGTGVNQRISVKDLSTGQYLVELTVNGKTVTSKFLKN